MQQSINTKGLNSLRVRISLMLILVALLLSASISFTALGLFTSHTRTEHLRTAKGVAMIADKIIDADSIERYKREGKSASGYEDTTRRLSELQKNVPDIRYLYVYQIREDGCHTIFDVDEENGDWEVDELIEFDPTFLPLVDDLLQGKEIEPLESNDAWGWLLTYYHPVFDSNGKCQCYVGVDISMDLLKTYKIRFLRSIIILSLVFVIVIVGFGLVITTKMLVNPINCISNYALEFISHKANLDGMKNCVSKIKRLEVHTHDEVENLYISFSNMTENTVQNIIDINRMQEERIQMMQRYNSELEKKVEERTY